MNRLDVGLVLSVRSAKLGTALETTTTSTDYRGYAPSPSANSRADSLVVESPDAGADVFTDSILWCEATVRHGQLCFVAHQPTTGRGVESVLGSFRQDAFGPSTSNAKDLYSSCRNKLSEMNADSFPT